MTFAAHSGIIRVPENYPKIQEAVDAANPGDTILVSAGTYEEGFILINKSLTIIGEGANSTVITPRGVNDIFEIHADNVTVSGFTIWSGPSSSVGLYDSRGCNITNNIMHGGWYTIALYNSSNNLIVHNTVFPITNGWGIFLYFNSDNNIIRANEITGAGEGIGIFVAACGNNKLEHNQVRENYNGIAIDESNNNVIKSNIVENNRVGIALGGGSGNRIYHNNLMDNPDDVWDTGRNVWDNGAEGNYWDDYNGTDLDGDGIGDSYLPWEGVDYYPLMAPWTLVRTFYVVLNETRYPVTVHSNSTIASFDFNQSLKQVSFSVTGSSGTLGFCSITIPKALLEGDLTVLVADERVTYTVTENNSHTFTYFTYEHSVKKVRVLVPIIGDLNFDGVVNIYDIVLAAAAYNSRPGDPNWNPYADLAPPYGIINIYDLVTAVSHYGKS
jgi:nitrous oxidase accessory protein